MYQNIASRSSKAVRKSLAIASALSKALRALIVVTWIPSPKLRSMTQRHSTSKINGGLGSSVASSIGSRKNVHVAFAVIPMSRLNDVPSFLREKREEEKKRILSSLYARRF